MPHFSVSVGDELTEVGWRTWKHRAAQVGKACLNRRVGEGRVDLPVEPVDDLGGRISGGNDVVNGARLVAWHEIGD